MRGMYTSPHTAAKITNVLHFGSSRYARAHNYHPDVGLVVAGGRDIGWNALKMAVISNDGGRTFTNLPDLPRPLSSACLVIIKDKRQVFVAGGHDGGK